jgi:type I restriction enzyme S subunit
MYDKGIVSPLYICFSANENNECPDFYVHYFEAGMMNREIQAFAQEGARNHGLLNISVDDFFNSYLLMPPLDEQKKIAEILSAQDKLIALKEKLIEEKKRQKKALMQQLITGKKRLPGFSEDWVSFCLKRVAERITRKNAIANNNVLTISAQYGLINQFEFFDKEIASEDKSNYYLLMQNEFAYNKSYSTNYPFGAIKKLTRYDMGIVSPLYICFRIVGNEVSTEYMEHYFEAGLMNSEIQSFAQEGARNHGLLNISVEDFFQSKIVIPPYEEQIAIARILSSITQEIDLLQQTLEQEKQKKKALMQLLLTGIVRV